MARETVDKETPAADATSAIVTLPCVVPTIAPIVSSAARYIGVSGGCDPDARPVVEHELCDCNLLLRRSGASLTALLPTAIIAQTVH